MTTIQVKELWQAKPFKPFIIHLEDGRKLAVKRPEFMWLPPGGRTIVVAQGSAEEDEITMTDVGIVTELTVGNGSRRRKI